MADPLAIASSVLAVFQIAERTMQALGQLRDTANCNNDIERLHQDVFVFTKVIRHTRTLLSTIQPDDGLEGEQLPLTADMSEQLRKLVQDSQYTLHAIQKSVDRFATDKWRLLGKDRLHCWDHINNLTQQWQILLPVLSARTKHPLSTNRHVRSVAGNIEGIRMLPNVESAQRILGVLSTFLWLRRGNNTDECGERGSEVGAKTLCEGALGIEQSNQAEDAAHSTKMCQLYCVHDVGGQSGLSHPSTKKWFGNKLNALMLDPVAHHGKPTHQLSYRSHVASSSAAALKSFACGLCMYNFDTINNVPGHMDKFVVETWLSFLGQPSTPTFVAATLFHGIATLAYYTLRSHDKFKEHFLTIGVIAGIGSGLLPGRNLESVVVGILPLIITSSLLLCTATNVVLQIFRKRQNGDGRGREDVERQSEATLQLEREDALLKHYRKHLIDQY